MADEPTFPWSDAIDMTGGGDGQRAVVICLNAVFEATMAVRDELRGLRDELRGRV